MSLVANYGSSDSETSDVESPAPSSSIAKSTSKSALGSLLPPPKAANKSSSSKTVIHVDLPKVGQSDDEEEQQAKRAKRQKVNTSGASDLASLLPAPKRGGYSLARTKPTPTKPTTSIADTLEQSLTARGEASSNAKKAEPIAEKKQVEAHLESEDEQQESELMQGQEEEEEEVPLDHSGPFFRLGKFKLSFSPRGMKRK